MLIKKKPLIKTLKSDNKLWSFKRKIIFLWTLLCHIRNITTWPSTNVNIIYTVISVDIMVITLRNCCLFLAHSSQLNPWKVPTVPLQETNKATFVSWHWKAENISPPHTQSCTEYQGTFICGLAALYSSRAPDTATPAMMPYCTCQKHIRNVTTKGSRSNSVGDTWAWDHS